MEYNTEISLSFYFICSKKDNLETRQIKYLKKKVYFFIISFIL